jgi:hypothetical protein
MQALVWLFVLIATGVYICGPIVDPDLWWHLTVGRWIVAHREIPSVDLWNMFGVGQPWRAYSWSNEVLFALIDGRFGAHGLLVLKLVLGAAIGVSLGYAFRSIARDSFIGAVLGVFATAACFNHFTLRPQSFVWIYFGLVLMVVERIGAEGLSARRAAGLFILMALWANTQITTVLGVGAITLWLFHGRASLGLVGRTVGCALAGTLCTPYVGGEWLTFISKSGHPLKMQAIAEFAPATIMQHSTVFLVLVGALVLMLVQRRPAILEPGKLVLAGAFTLGALAVVKFIPFAVMVWCALAALAWQRSRTEPSVLGNLGEALERLRRVVVQIPAEGLSFVLICTIIVNVHNLWAEPISRIIVPIDAVDFMQKHNVPHPILHDFGRGGYIMYRYAKPDGTLEHRVPIDGRTNVTPPEVIIQARVALRGLEGWEEYFDAVKPETILWKTESPLVNILRAGSEWCQVHRSGLPEQGYAVFVKRSYLESNPGELVSPQCGATEPERRLRSPLR